MAAQYQRWITEGIVREEMEKLSPEIREQVVSIIDTFKADKKDMTEKSLQEIMAYVRCPHCWTRVYKTNTILASGTEDEPSGDTQEKHDVSENEKKEAADGTSMDYSKLNGCFNL